MTKKETNLIGTDNASQFTQYQNLLSNIKSRLKTAQLRAAIAVNHQLIQFYWGKLVS